MVERGEIRDMVEESVNSAIQHSKNEILTGVQQLISLEMKKLSENQRTLSDFQISKIADLSSDYKFKRRSNEEQFKINKKVLGKLDDCERNLELCELDKAKENLAEASTTLKHRQKVIRLADESELGWKVVDEYMQSEIASDEEDQKKIHRAQARARVKAKSERTKRNKRFTPYRPRPTYPVDTTAYQTYQTRTQPSQQQQQQKPGLCFLCGQAGHWKSDCPTNKRNYKLSISEHSLCYSAFQVENAVHLRQKFQMPCLLSKSASEGETSHIYNDVDQVKKVSVEKPASAATSPETPDTSHYNRLKKAAPVWRKAGSSSYILSVIEEGYKLPLKEVPPAQKSRNNKSARDNPEFVTSEIMSLLSRGCISRVTQIPHIINPLTVAYNKKAKPRLVLDCRNVNKCLHTFKFKYEDISTARQMFEKGSYLYSFDIRGAYNHIDIYESHRTYLGFAWCDKNGQEIFYVYNSLPFGLATAGHIFSKVVRVMVTLWRSKGLQVITFLDDGLGGDSTYDRALQSSHFVRESIQEFGFLLAEEKCEWLPKLQITWLGYYIRMDSGKFFITDERISRLELSLKSMLGQLASQELRIVPARFAASVVGQIISMQMVIGKTVRLKTRELYKCIDSRLSWDSPVYISEMAEQEVKFWFHSARFLNLKGGDFSENLVFETMLFCDASKDGYGGYVEHSDINAVGDFLWSNNSLQTKRKRNEEEIKAVTPVKGKAVTPECVKEIASKAAKVVTPERVKTVAPEVARAVTPEVVKFNTLAVAQTPIPVAVKLVTPEEVQSKVKPGFSSLSTESKTFKLENVNATNLQQIKLFSPKVLKRASPEETNPLTPEVVRLGSREMKPVLSTKVKPVALGVDRSVFKKTSGCLIQSNTSESEYPAAEVFGTWNEFESKQSSTWREAEAIKRVIISNADYLKGKQIKVFSDNKNIQSVLEAGSRKDDIQKIASQVNDFCERNQISLSVGWIPRHLNERADHLSRCKDCDDWQIANWVFNKLERKWGPYTIDRFASSYNTKCKRFNTRWWMPGTEGIDALNQNWSEPENNWLVPPPRLVLSTVQKLQVDKGRGIGLTANVKNRLESVNVREDGLAERISTYLLCSKADKTNEKYRAAFKKFQQFCVDKGYKSLPADPIHVTIFISNLLDKNCSFSVISSVYYAIKWAHDVNNYLDPTENGFVKSLLEAAKRLKSQPVKRKDVVNSAMLISLCDQYVSSSVLSDIRDLAMILLCYSGFLRFDEASKLRCNDVTFNDDHFIINIRSSKTDQFRSGSKVLIAKGHTSACPYSMLNRYISSASIDLASSDFLFKPMLRTKGNLRLIKKEKCLSYTRTRECILKKLKSVAPDLNLGTHSLRAGGTTTAANTDSVSERCLMRHGRWKTETSKNMYVDDSVSKKLRVSKALGL